MVKSEILRGLVEARVLEVRRVDDGIEPFKYSGGGFGPGYVRIQEFMTAGLPLAQHIVYEISSEVMQKFSGFNLIAGIEMGGVVWGRDLNLCLRRRQHMHIPYAVVKKGKKDHGDMDEIVGLRNAEIRGNNCLLVEDVINTGKNTVQAADKIHNHAFNTPFVVAVCHYQNPKGIDTLKKRGISSIYLFSLGELLDAAEAMKAVDKVALDDFRKFLEDPIEWMEDFNK